jgi:hypothetical protein
MQNDNEGQLTIEGLNATYIISRQVESVEVKVTVVGVHYGVWIPGVPKPQGMAKLVDGNKKQVFA